MDNPCHNLKCFVNRFGDKHDRYSYTMHAYGWLASGIVDRNGKEIFEGDTVLLDNRLGVVRFANAQFYIDRDGDDNVPFTLNCLCTPFLEVVGHIAEEQP